MGKIRIVTADITGLDVDAIVNAANSHLLGGGGVDGAIHRAAGPELREFNAGLGGCPTGQAKISPGFQLTARWVISTVGPIWHDGRRGEAEMLRACYRASLKLARENGIRSIAFPAISTGVYNYPKAEAAVIALEEMKKAQDQFDDIIACCFSEDDTTYYRALRLDCD